MEQKRGRGKKILKRDGRKLSQGVGALRGGSGTPLQTMDLPAEMNDLFRMFPKNYMIVFVIFI